MVSLASLASVASIAIVGAAFALTTLRRHKVKEFAIAMLATGSITMIAMLVEKLQAEVLPMLPLVSYVLRAVVGSHW
jgi:hypothetical protein